MSEKKAKKERKETPPTPKVLAQIVILLTDAKPNLQIQSTVKNRDVSIQLLADAIKALANPQEPSRIIPAHTVIPGGFGRA